MSGIMMAERLWRERKERIRKENIASVTSPLAVRVATGFILEHDSELGNKSEVTKHQRCERCIENIYRKILKLSKL